MWHRQILMFNTAITHLMAFYFNEANIANKEEN
jgi:hypothetical protein